jgi:hypothetical protein
MGFIGKTVAKRGVEVASCVDAALPSPH